MNNLIQLNSKDPISQEFEAFVDKVAGIKTIAFKYFSADIQQASTYLDVPLSQESNETEGSIPLHVVIEVQYYQPELLK